MIMSIDERKIGITCFIGCAIGTAVAFAVAPWLWWIGLLTGCAVGYLACGFREVMAAIPVAARYAVSGSSFAMREVLRGFLSFWRRPLLVEVVLPNAVMIAGLSVYTLLYGAIPPDGFLGYATMFFPFLVPGIVLLPAFLGECDGFGEVRYGFLFKSQVKGAKILFRLTILFVVWYLWKWLFLGIGYGIKFLSQFSWYLFKLIHSDKRLLCGVDSALGVVVTFLWVHHYPIPASLSLGQYAMVVFFGGCVGAVLGVVSWKFISVKCLGMPEYSPI